MPHDGNAGSDDAAHRFGQVLTPLQLDRLRASFFQDATRVANRIRRFDVVAQERHVSDNVDVLGGPHDRLYVVNHLVHGDGHGGIVAENHVSQAVAHQYYGNSRLFENPGRGVIVRGHHGYLLATVFHILQVLNRDAHSAPPSVLRHVRTSHATRRHLYNRGSVVWLKWTPVHSDPWNPPFRDDLTGLPVGPPTGSSTRPL